MSIPLYEKIFVTAIGALLLTGSLLSWVANGQDGSWDDTDGDNTIVMQSGSYEGIPSADRYDGKFLAIAGTGHSTINGTEVIAYIGVPSNESAFEVGIFDGDVGDHWDFEYSPYPVTRFTLYMDSLKNGTTASAVKTWVCTSNLCKDNQWYNQTFTVSPGAQAPSGNYFYRLEAEWDGGTPEYGLNDFKIRTTVQISLAAGQEFGFAGGPQAGIDPDFGPLNTYDGEWCYNFYVPVTTARVTFYDGDADRKGDTDDPNTPDPEGESPGLPEDDNESAKYRRSPDIYVVVTDPEGHIYTNNNPSGNAEWELFSIGNLTNDDYFVGYPLSSGLWEYKVKGMDAHNANFLKATYEIFVCGSTPPLPVNPPPEVEPDHIEEVPGDATYYYQHTITNKGVAQAYDLRTESPLGWSAGIYEDSNANGIYDIGEPEINETLDLGTNEAYDVLVAVDVPIGPPGETDFIQLTASSQIEWAVQDSAYDEITILQNQPPLPDAGGSYLADEGDTVTFDASGSYDLDGDSLQYMWDIDDDGIFETNYSSNPTYSYVFGDDYTGTARLRVTDGTYEVEALADVTIVDVAPSVQGYLDSRILAGITFRIAGEKWHDVEFFLYEDGTEVAYAQIVRYPGNPDDQTVTVSGLNISLSSEYSVLALYTPMDDPINGQIWGSTPAWVILDFDDGNDTRIHHTFNVRHNETWTWEIGRLNEYFAGHNFTFHASAYDPGSDDLTFMWDWGDNSTEARTYFNDGIGPDPYPSPDVNPISVDDVATHSFPGGGTYVVTLTVTDDDGGSTIITLTVSI